MNEKLKYYVVTGASNGIGYETVVALLKEKDIAVLAISRSTDKLLRLQEEAGNRLHILSFDLEKDNASTVKYFLNERGIQTLHGIVHNAGYLVNKPFETIEKNELEHCYRVNVFAPFLLTQALLPLLKKASNAHIVCISSMGGIQGSVKFSGLSAYSSSKGALSILSECMAQEFSETNIKVNCLAIGSVQTEMLNNAFPGYKAPLQANQMAEYVCWFLLNGQKFFNGKTIPVALSTP